MTRLGTYFVREMSSKHFALICSRRMHYCKSKPGLHFCNAALKGCDVSYYRLLQKVNFVNHYNLIHGQYKAGHTKHALRVARPISHKPWSQNYPLKSSITLHVRLLNTPNCQFEKFNLRFSMSFFSRLVVDFLCWKVNARVWKLCLKPNS